MVASTFPRRLVKLVGMIQWAIFDGRFEPDDDRRIPLGRALTFAWEHLPKKGTLADA